MVAVVLVMRKEYNNGTTLKEIWQRYAPDKSWSTVYNAVTKQTYKDIN